MCPISPTLQVLFQYTPVSSGSGAGRPFFGDITSQAYSTPARLSRAKMDLFVSVTGGHLDVEFMAELFDETTAARLLASYVQVLEHAVALPTFPAMSASMLGAADRQLVAHVSCGPLRPDHLEGPLLHEAFTALAEQHPSRRCLVFEGAEMNYGQVNAAAEALAASLAGMGVVRGTPVGIMLDRSFELVIAILGVLKAGGGSDVGLPLPVLLPGC